MSSIRIHMFVVCVPDAMQLTGSPFRFIKKSLIGQQTQQGFIEIEYFLIKVVL